MKQVGGTKRRGFCLRIARWPYSATPRTHRTQALGTERCPIFGNSHVAELHYNEGSDRYCTDTVTTRKGRAVISIPAVTVSR